MLDWLASAAGVALVVAALRTHRTLRAALAPGERPERLRDYPSLSVIRPIKGLDPAIEENLRAALDHGYPGALETLFVFDDADEPALPLVKRVLAGQRATGGRAAAEIVLCGAPPPGRTGKLNAMIHGLRRARGDLVAFVDSDVRADRDALRVAVETLLSDPKAGSAAAPAVVTPPPRSLPDAASCVLLNGLYGPSSRLSAHEQGELPFIMGQLMVLRREALNAIGNLEDVAGNFVDDIQIGVHVRRAGFRNLLSAHAVEIIWFGFRWPEFVANFVRWMTFSRGFPDWRSFKLPIVWRVSTFFLGIAGGLALLLSGHALASLPWWGAAAVVTGSLAGLHAGMGGSPLRPRHWIAPAAVLLLAPLVFLRVYTQRRVEWRGRSYELDAAGRLARRA